MSEASSESIWIVTDEPTEEKGSKGNNIPRIGSWVDETDLETEGKRELQVLLKLAPKN